MDVPELAYVPELAPLCNQESGAVFALCSLRHPDAGVGQKGAFCKGIT